ncbi:hypothetical protein K431DRAFT_311394 [Polychaeton citri CBS 116435]|uniref:Choline monooxygenase, chloroplastic n=1 Tax=Polychaeton citri CBS 116435 TaxID=1314669 RepID=A0A9P4URV2_9PEZI|nr:hypothetical protein K431DRAFT_311394 [Polychaeton citri CBS 116435]
MADSLPRTLPASWYCNPQLYQLERRAVFLKAWYLLGPVVKFADSKEFQYEFAGVTLHAQQQIQEQASRVIVKTSEGSTVRSHVTSTGLLFTTVSDDAPSFKEYFPGLEDVLATVDFTKRPYRRSIGYPGHFNWKTMVDGYQECLHCAYTHPSFSELYPPHSYNVINYHNWSRHVADPAKPNDGLFLYLFPICTLNVYGGGMSLFRVNPTSDPGTTRMEFDYFNVDEGEKFEEYYKFVRQVAIEDFELCEKAQYNLERGIYAEGILNPVKETGVAYYQQRVLELCIERHQSEKQRKLLATRQDSRQARSQETRTILGSRALEIVTQ